MQIVVYIRGYVIVEREREGPTCGILYLFVSNSAEKVQQALAFSSTLLARETQFHELLNNKYWHYYNIMQKKTRNQTCKIRYLFQLT